MWAFVVEISGYTPLSRSKIVPDCFLGGVQRVKCEYHFQEEKGILKLRFPSVRYFFFVVIFSAVAVKATSELELRAVSMES